jgi:hypothetical protein
MPVRNRMFSIRRIIEKLRNRNREKLDKSDKLAYCSTCHMHTLHKFIKRKKGCIVLRCYDCGTKRTWLTVEY